MSVTMHLVIGLLLAQTAVIRPPADPPRTPAQESHTKVLPQEIALFLLGSYDLDKPLSTGEKEFYATVVDDKLRLRIGESERLLVYERLGTEEIGGVKSADVYGFTVVGRPGMTVQFKVLNKRVTYVNVFEDFANPPVAATGKPKRR